MRMPGRPGFYCSPCGRYEPCKQCGGAEVVTDTVLQPADWCGRCRRPYADVPGGRREVPFSMDIWEHDVPILGAMAGEAVWFTTSMCAECAAAEVGL